MKTANKVLTVIFVIAVMLLIITSAIGVPIYCRSFYYNQIDSLGIVSDSGFSYDEIKGGFDEVMDYLVGKGEFGTGVFKFSESGKSHFVDCKVLFDLNITILIISGIIVVGLLITSGVLKKIELLKFKGLHPMFFSGVIMIVLLAVIGFLVSLDFYRAFEIFHAIFFIGKDNWVFDSRFDQIILALPSQFFLNCGIVILSVVIIVSVLLIIAAIIMKMLSRKKSLSNK